MELKARFDVKYLENAMHYLKSLPEKVQDKIAYNISKSRYFVDKELFKKLNENIWEFRTRYQGMTYRLLAFWDNDADSLVIATHGFIKKTQKTPENEIARAEELRKQYFNNKKIEMEEMKIYSHEDMLDSIIGKRGTARRDTMEAELQSYLIGEAIRQARKEKNLTQTQLGDLMGVQRAQVSRIEKGHNLTVGTIVRAFKAMGVPASFSFGNVSFSLC